MRSPNKNATQIVKNSTEVRRIKQYGVLKLWDAGRITANQCIDNILELEKVVFVGDNFRPKQEEAPKEAPK